MIVGQLWYGWAARGAEGTNQEQIIAGSGNLADRSSALAQFVLQWCYDSHRLAFGWVEREGVVVAFRRTPTGLDASGRSGAFFVHALVWRGGLLAPELLAGLSGAHVWMTEPPDEPPAQLEPLRGVESLGLGPSVDVDAAALKRYLGSHLANVAQGRGSVIDDEDDALGIASRIAAALPARFGLPAFSSHESERTASQYDLLAPPAPEQLFSPVRRGGDPDPLSAKAAQILLSARHGDRLARSVVDALAEGTPSVVAFVDAFRHWAALDGRRPQHPAPAVASLAVVAGDPRLVASLVERGNAATLARGIVEGEGARELMSAAERSGSATTILDELCNELLNRTRLAAWAALQRLEVGAPAVRAAARRGAREVVARPGPPGRAERRGCGRPGAVARAEPPTEEVEAAARELLGSATATRALVEDVQLPAGWRGRAAAGHPEAVPDETLVRLVLDEPPFARMLLESAGETVVARLEDALARMTPQAAVRCAEIAARHLPEPTGVRVLSPAIDGGAGAGSAIARSAQRPAQRPTRGLVGGVDHRRLCRGRRRATRDGTARSSPSRCRPFAWRSRPGVRTGTRSPACWRARAVADGPGSPRSGARHRWHTGCRIHSTATSRWRLSWTLPRTASRPTERPGWTPCAAS